MGVITVWAAITGSISGVVADPSGAVVPGVTVVATEISTNVRHTTVTDAKGFYAFPALDVGHYNVVASQPGFRDFLESGVTINANSAIRIDIKMVIGAVSNTVKVRSDVLQVETQSTQMGDVIEGEKITSVPLNGRSYIDLLALQPGVSPYSDTATSAGSGVTSISGGLGQGLQSVNGGQPEGNGFMVNGADAEEGVHNGAAMIPNLDSIAQFRIITNNFNAEYGNFSGGQINVVTKSGANQFHGDAFDFLRNTDLDAKNYFSSNRGVFIQNQFGGTIGGPIKRDKLFFFGDFQGTKQIVGAATNFPVPSVADRTGNLIDQAAALETSDPANGGQGVEGAYFASILSQELGYPVTNGEPYYSTGCTDTATCVFPNAVIPASAISPVAQNMLKYIPTPTSVQNGQPYYRTSAFNQTLSDYKGGIRIDTNTRYGALFGYYFVDTYTVDNPYAAVNIPGFDAGSNGLTQMGNFGLTTTLSNSMVNDVRLVYLRNVNFSGVPKGGLGVTLSSLGFNTPWGPTGGIDSTDPALEGVPNVGFNNYSFGVPADTLRQFNNTIQAIDNVMKIFGTHTLQFGGDFHYDQINERNTYGQNGQFGFGGQETGFDFADYLIGAPNYFIQASFQILDSRSKYYGFYAQDRWRVTPTVTMNYGLRWEVSTPWYDTQNKLETLIQGEQSLAFPGAPTGLVLPGDPGVPRTLSPVKYTNFAPRFGIAFSPAVTEGWLGKLLGGAGKSSIRAGYGIFYTSIIDATGFVEVGDAPYGLFYASPGPPLLASPYVTRQTGQVQPNAFPFVFPPTNVSPKNPAT
ncbi:MAG: TonB-dependent receptor domain-containing protein, partial [Acidobacteriaceae bacterium]